MKIEKAIWENWKSVFGKNEKLFYENWKSDCGKIGKRKVVFVKSKK